MARSLHKAWKDKRSGWTRRVRWYMPADEWASIRLCFEDESGMVNLYFRTSTSAQLFYDAFKDGEKDVRSMWGIRHTIK